MPELTFITCRVHALDEIEYTLSVYEGSTGYIGFWGCGKCRDEGGIEKRAASREEALDRCYRAVEQHHAAQHRPAEPPQAYAV